MLGALRVRYRSKHYWAHVLSALYTVTEKLTPMEIMIIYVYIYRCLDDVGKSKTIVN